MKYLALLAIFAALPAFAQNPTRIDPAEKWWENDPVAVDPVDGGPNDWVPHAPLTSQQLEERKQLEERNRHLQNAIGLLEQMEVMVDQIAAEKKVHCMKSVGNLQFCTCIANESPPAVSFVGYISATSLTNEELHYSSLSPNDRKAIDNSRAARVKCLGPAALN